MKQLRPIDIAVQDQTHYEVTFRADGSESNELRFVFAVTNASITAVEWSHEFFLAISGDLEQATPLFRAILALYEARHSAWQLTTAS